MNKINEKLSAYIDEHKDECEDMAIASNKAYVDELKAELETYKKALETCIEKLHDEIYYEQPDCISYDKEYFTTDYWLAKAKEGK